MRIRAKIITKNYELEERRVKLGYSQSDFAEIIGVNVNTYQKIEQMKQKPTEDQAMSIAIELDAPRKTLFPDGYEKIVNIFNTNFERIADFTPPLLENDEKILLEASSTKSIIEDALTCLPPKERKVIELRYGINDKDPKTFEEVGNAIGVTRERVRQIEAKAMDRMRYKLKEK